MNRSQVFLTQGPTTSPTSSWTKRDEEILYAMSTQVRIFTEEQLISTYWKPGSDPGRKRVALLRKAGLLNRHRVQVNTLPQMREPVLRWRPGEPVPRNEEEISYKLCSRWTKVTSSTVVYVASQKTANLFGRTSRYQGLPGALEIAHDLCLTEIFCNYRRANPELISKWMGEDAIPKRHGVKAPDAWLLEGDGQPIRLIEQGGHYSAMRIAESLGYAVNELNVEFELW